MDIFIKTTAGILIAVVLCMILSKYSKDYTVILVVVVCCMVGTAAMGYLQRVIEFVEKLIAAGNLNRDLISILFKAVGIGLLTEITSLICTDSGNAALAKSVQLLASAVILWLCIPLFTELLELVEGVLTVS